MGFNFIDYFVDYTAEAESPTEFFVWSGIVALAAIARDNVHIDTSVIKIYPNIYVLLYARSGAAKKATPLKKIEPIIKAVKNTVVIEGRTSLQHAISTLAKGVVGPDGNIVAGASGLLFSEELSSLIIKDDQAIDYLTDLYDYHSEWTSNTHSRGQEKLERVCLSLLSATNEKLFRQVFTAEAIYGGLLSRTLIVAATQARKKNSLMFAADKALSDQPLIEHLFRVSHLRGAMTIEPFAKEYFHNWYMNQNFDRHDSETGLEWRLSTHILKVAMLLSLADEKLDKVIELRHIKRAMELVLRLIPNYKLLSTNVTMSEESRQTVVVMKAILVRAGEWIEHAEIIRQHWFEIDLKTMDTTIEKLILGNLVERGFASDGSIIYRATKFALDQYLSAKAEAESEEQ